MTTEDQGGRVFFSSTGRSLEGEDEIVVLSVGVDIGSSTSHLVFSRIVLERLDSRYVVTERETFYASDILLTPYSAENTIDADALGAFIKKEYADAKVDPDEIDTGALILTGVAVQRKNARAIGDLFARQAGKLVAVSAGDSLETVMAAYGSGAAARSIRDGCVVMNVDVGGGTSKIAVCADGKVIDLTAVDVGARLVCLEPDGKITRVEEAGRRYGQELGIDLQVGGMLTLDQGRALAGLMADKLFETMRGGAPQAQGKSLLRTDPLSHKGPVAQIQFSGGVSEFIYGNEAKKFGDLGPLLAAEIRARVDAFCPRLEPSIEGIRATVVGASQYTIQLSGSTIYVAPLDAVPLRNVPVIAPELPLDQDTIDPASRRARNANDAQAARSQRRRAAGRGVRAVAGLGDVSAARRILPRRGRGAGERAGERPSAGAGRRWRRRRPARHSPARGNEARESRGVDRRARAQGVRLHRHRHDAGKLRRGAGGDQIADLSGQRDGRRSDRARQPLQRNQQHHAQHGDRAAGGARGETNRQAAREGPWRCRRRAAPASRR